MELRPRNKIIYCGIILYQFCNNFVSSIEQWLEEMPFAAGDYYPYGKTTQGKSGKFLAYFFLNPVYFSRWSFLTPHTSQSDARISLANQNST